MLITARVPRLVEIRRLPDPKITSPNKPVTIDASGNDRRFLSRGNDDNVLQRTHRPEHEWLRIKRWVCIEWRWRQHVFHSDLRK
jgi:hypothetical protein